MEYPRVEPRPAACAGLKQNIREFLYQPDFSKPEVVDHIHGQLRKVLGEANISYVKWDMCAV